MKKTLPVLLLFLTMATCALGQDFERPAEGKSLVYFVRLSGTGALINFRYFDGDRYLGKMNGTHFFKYECDPGKHVFWAAAENRDFLQGDLKPNATYVIEVQPTMGAFKAAVRLYHVTPNSEKTLRRVQKIMAKKAPTVLKGKGDDMAFFIKNGMKRYEKIKNNVKQMDPDGEF